ncbi:MAG: Sec-independent protein translocase protein TatB [Pseudooceanicola sp.]
MGGLGWTEILLIGIVALIVVGPKDLPVLFRNVGRFVGKARGMAREFSRAMEDAADESGVKDISKSLRDATNPGKMGLDKLKEATDFKPWEPDSETGKLAADRADAAKKIQAATADKAAKRKAKEAEEAAKAAEAARAEADAPSDPAPADPAPEASGSGEKTASGGATS